MATENDDVADRYDELFGVNVFWEFTEPIESLKEEEETWGHSNSLIVKTIFHRPDEIEVLIDDMEDKSEGEATDYHRTNSSKDEFFGQTEPEADGNVLQSAPKSCYFLRSNVKGKKTFTEAKGKENVNEWDRENWTCRKRKLDKDKKPEIEVLIDDMEDKPESEATDYYRTYSSKNKVFGQKSYTEPEADGDVLQSEPKSSYSLRSNVNGEKTLTEAKGKNEVFGQKSCTEADASQSEPKSRYSLRSNEKGKTLTEAKGKNVNENHGYNVVGCHYSLEQLREDLEKKFKSDDYKKKMAPLFQRLKSKIKEDVNSGCRSNNL